MSMQTHLQRAVLLWRASRFEDAERELRQFLAAEPNNSIGQAAMAQVLCERKDYRAAANAVELALQLDPECGLAHDARSKVLLSQGRVAEAESAAREALRLESNESRFWGQLSYVLACQSRWQEALDAADEGLRVDPTDVSNVNRRALSLTLLGRGHLADQTLLTALAEAPDTPRLHATLGWSQLAAAQPKESIQSFREALRLDPQLNYARKGLIEATKAQFFPYLLTIRFQFWFSRLSAVAAWAYLIALYAGFQFLLRLHELRPSVSSWLMPLLISWVGVAYLPFVSESLSDLVLLPSQFGRCVLTRVESITACLIGLCTLSAVTALVLGLIYGVPGSFRAALALMFVTPLLARYRRCPPGGPRRSIGWLVVMTGLIGLLASIDPWIARDPSLWVLRYAVAVAGVAFHFVPPFVQISQSILSSRH